MSVRRAATWAVALATFAGTTASAQNKKDDKAQPASACKLDFGANSTLDDANKTLATIPLSKAEEQTKRLQSVVKSLTDNPDKFKDQVARNYLLGQALATWASRPGTGATMRRGDVGYASNADGQVDVLAATDTALTAVETAAPQCKAETENVRLGPWSKLINQVPPLVNRDQLDSATAAIQRSLVIYRESPYTYYFEGNIAQKKSDWTAAGQSFSKVVTMTTPEVLAKDTTLKQVREYSLFASAYSHQKLGQAASGDAQKQHYAAAVEGYKQYLKEYPNGPNAQNAQNMSTSLLSQTGDTAAVTALWKQMLASPDKYDYLQFFDAGVDAFQGNHKPEAAQLIEAGLQKNPNYRTALYNLANTYRALNQPDKEVPIVQRLIAVDPSNPDNQQLLALAYQDLAKTTTDPKLKKARMDSVSMLLQQADRIPARVTFTQFTHDGSKHILAGNVENLTAAPRTDTLNFEFLDKAGTKVATSSAVVQSKAKEKVPFNVNVTQDGVIAFRYAPLPLQPAKKAGS